MGLNARTISDFQRFEIELGEAAPEAVLVVGDDLIDPDSLCKRAERALGGYAGDLNPGRNSIDIACRVLEFARRLFAAFFTVCGPVLEQRNAGDTALAHPGDETAQAGLIDALSGNFFVQRVDHAGADQVALVPNLREQTPVALVALQLLAQLFVGGQ